MNWLRALIAIGAMTLLLCGACSPSADPVVAPPPPPTPTPVTLYATRAHVVSPSVTVLSEPATGVQEASLAPSQPCTSATEQEVVEIQVDAEALLDYPARHVRVRETITFRNTTGAPLANLVLYVAPNKQPGVFALQSVRLEGYTRPAVTTLEHVRLVIALDEPLMPGCAHIVHMSFALHLPPIGNEAFPRQGYFGYSNNQLNLGLWLPSMAPFVAGEWLTPVPINVGEQSVLPAADYRVRLYVRNAPENLAIAGPGEVNHRSGQWEFRLRQGRELALSLSTQYHRLTATTRSGVQVELYTLNDAQPAAETPYDAPLHALDTAVRALELFTDLYGEYPYERLVVVESVFPDGMEFSGLVFVGSEWFRSYTGDAASYLTLITAHEVAHQWWYHLVGNDQSREPWLDEALCIYSEYVYLQENYPELTEWWWAFRINAFTPQGNVDSTVYEFDTVRAYINAVYLRGAQLMHAIRHQIGTAEFFNWLQSYRGTMQGKIATASDLWHALSQPALDATRSDRQHFLRVPGP